jgi:hypothetical protein
MRLNYSHSLAQIETGIAAIGALLKEQLQTNYTVDKLHNS